MKNLAYLFCLFLAMLLLVYAFATVTNPAFQYKSDDYSTIYGAGEIQQRSLRAAYQNPGKSFTEYQSIMKYIRSDFFTYIRTIHYQKVLFKNNEFFHYSGLRYEKVPAFYVLFSLPLLIVAIGVVIRYHHKDDRMGKGSKVIAGLLFLISVAIFLLTKDFSAGLGNPMIASNYVMSVTWLMLALSLADNDNTVFNKLLFWSLVILCILMCVLNCIADYLF